MRHGAGHLRHYEPAPLSALALLELHALRLRALAITLYAVAGVTPTQELRLAAGRDVDPVAPLSHSPVDCGPG